MSRVVLRCRWRWLVAAALVSLSVVPTAYARPTLAPAAAGTVGGRGTDDDPYVAPCDNPGGVDCTVNAFPEIILRSFWTSKVVPAYRCPAGHEYLIHENYVSFGTLVPRGVEIAGLGPVGVSITAFSSKAINQYERRATGTRTGASNATATNWSDGPAAFRVILHCTSDANRGWEKG